ncbi:MAG: hypothetical protein NDI81_06820 [Desulfobacula sp.]|nr:hypothetical protein [Desulfobacula sp.]MDA8136816.1 hypothetical protein [Desulfobacteraceae bacterium]
MRDSAKDSQAIYRYGERLPKIEKPSMEMILDTSRHCIETASKKEYERLIQQYFKFCSSGKEKSILEQRIDALAYLLKHADFPNLRNQYHAMGHSEIASILVIPRSLKDMHIRLNQDIVHPAWKKP